MILILINIIVLGLIFIDIQVIQAPETTISISVVEIDENSITINTSLNLRNPNLISIDLDDLQVIVDSSDNNTIGTFNISGGYIDADGEKIFSSEETFSLSADSFKEFKSIIATVTGNVKVKVLSVIEKTVPFMVTINALFDVVIDDIGIPTIQFSASVDEVNEQGVILSGTLDIYNPNPFSLTIETLSLNITSSDEDPIGSLILTGGEALPKQSVQFPFIFEGRYTLFNKDTITIDIDAKAGARIAGLHQTISFGTQAEFDVPDIRELLSLDDIVAVTLTGSFQFTFRGIKTRISLLIDNPTTLPLRSENMTLIVSRIDDDEKESIVQKNMTEHDIGAKNQTCVSVEVTIPYRSLFSMKRGKLIPDYLGLTIYGEATLEGLNQSLPLEINGYLDPHLLRKL